MAISKYPESQISLISYLQLEQIIAFIPWKIGDDDDEINRRVSTRAHTRMGSECNTDTS